MSQLVGLSTKAFRKSWILEICESILPFPMVPLKPTSQITGPPCPGPPTEAHDGPGHGLWAAAFQYIAHEAVSQSKQRVWGRSAFIMHSQW